MQRYSVEKVRRTCLGTHSVTVLSELYVIFVFKMRTLYVHEWVLVTVNTVGKVAEHERERQKQEVDHMAALGAARPTNTDAF
jgi:hypothetical protein